MEAPLRKLWLVPALTLALLPAADAVSLGSSSSPSSSGSHSKGGKSKKSSSKCATCPRDSHGKIKRSAKARQEFMKQTGHPHGWPGHVVDYIKPLECGGADAPSNMQWRTVAEAKAKDKTERACR